VFKIIDDMPNERDFTASVHETMIHGVAEWHDQAWHDFIVNDPWHLAGTSNRQASDRARHDDGC